MPTNVRLNSTRYFIIEVRNGRELQQIALTHLSNINSQDFINLYKNMLQRPYSFLVTDASLALENPLPFRWNLIEIIQKLITTINDRIRDKNLQYDISREAEQYHHYHQTKLINMKKHWVVIKENNRTS